MPGFTYKVNGNTGYYTIDEFEYSGKVKTCFTARVGGVSQGSFSSLNLGYKSGDIKSNIDRNFKILCKFAGFNIEDMVLSDQVHGEQCGIVGYADRGKGTIIKSDIYETDALVTNEKNVVLCIFTADCVPVYLFDRVNNAIALCHAGWRGVVKEIVPKTINIMKKTYGSNPLDITAAIGPSIGPCCFYVGNDVVREFEKIFDNVEGIIIKENEKFKIDLWKAIEMQLRAAGLNDKSIISSKLCTSCDKTKFYSYRRDGAETGRMMSIIQLI